MPEILISTHSGSGTQTIKIIKPSNYELHRGYNFYIKITATGINTIKNPADTTAYLGPYDLRVGCYTDSVTFTDSSSFITTVPVFVGNSTIARYKFYEPTSNRAWCIILRNEIRTEQGFPWSVAGGTQVILPSADSS